MHKHRVILLIGASRVACAITTTAQSNNRAGGASAGAALIVRAAEALGGRNRILAVKTLTIEGYGQLAHQNGGGNITSSIDAPQKWVSVTGYVRTVDLEHLRTRVRQRQAAGDRETDCQAQALCASVDVAGLSMPGCPVKTTVDR